jgi:P-type Cu+ transporter
MSSAALSSEESCGSGESPRLVRVELLVGGMTCAACAAKVENKLNALENVSATVNYATEKARAASSMATPSSLGVKNGSGTAAWTSPPSWRRRSVARHPERRTAAPVSDNPPEDGSQPEEQAASCLE